MAKQKPRPTEAENKPVGGEEPAPVVVSIDYETAMKMLQALADLRSAFERHDAGFVKAVYAEDWPAVRGGIVGLLLEIEKCVEATDVSPPRQWVATNLIADVMVAADEGRPHQLTNHTRKKVRANRNDPTRKGLMALGAAVVQSYGCNSPGKKQQVGRKVAAAMTDGGFLSERDKPIGGPMMVQHAMALAKLEPPALTSGSSDYMRRWLIAKDREYFDTHVKLLTDCQSSLPAALKFLTSECKRQLSLS